MRRPLKKKLLAAAIALAATVSSAAHAAVVFTFDTTAVAGPAAAGTKIFLADELTFRSLGTNTLTIVDGGSGTLDPLGPLGTNEDKFTENGLVFTTSFVLGGVGVLPGVSGLGVEYDLFAVFDPAVAAGTGLAGEAGLVGADAVALFTPAFTSAKIYYDSTVNGTFDAATASLIGTLTLGTGNCVLTGAVGGTFAEGSCGLEFLFDAGGVSDAGVWTVGGEDLGLLNAAMTLDVDVDSITPPIATVFPGGPGSSQVVEVIHDGSSTFRIPEPGTLALLSVALLGLGGLLRMRQGE